MLPNIDSIRALSSEKMKALKEKEEKESIEKERLFNECVKRGTEYTLRCINEEIIKEATAGKCSCTYDIDVIDKMGKLIYEALMLELKKDTQYQIQCYLHESRGNSEYPDMKYMKVEIIW